MTARGPFLLGSVLAASLMLGGANPAAGADVPEQAFAESFGLQVEATLAQGSAVVAPASPVAASCAPGAPAKDTATAGPVGVATVARSDRLSTSAESDCVSATGLAVAEARQVEALAAGGPIVIRADAVESRSMASCGAGPAGSTTFANLTVGGVRVPLPAEVAPNTVLLPEVFGPLGMQVTLNEQRPAASGRGLVVNGIHIVATINGVLPPGGVLARGDVVISHAVSAVACRDSADAAPPRVELELTQVASRQVAKPGDAVRLTATVTNSSSAACEVLRVVDHLPPAFTLVSTTGSFGSAVDRPRRADGGVDVVFRPTGVTIAPGETLTQAVTVRIGRDAAPGSYSSNVELACGPQGDFVSGPLAAVSVLGPQGSRLADTGATPALAVTAFLLLLLGLGMRRSALR